jgi:hypothetical protein
MWYGILLNSTSPLYYKKFKSTFTDFLKKNNLLLRDINLQTPEESATLFQILLIGSILREGVTTFVSRNTLADFEKSRSSN